MKRIILTFAFALLASACAKQTPPPANPPPASGDPNQPQQNPESQPEQGQQNPNPGGGW